MRLILVDDVPGGVVQLAVEGAVSAADVSDAQRNPLGELLGDRWSQRKILLDLDRASHLDSSAIGWLLDCQRRLEEGGGMLVLHSIPPVIRQGLELLRIGTILPLAAGQAEAVDLVTAPS